MKYDPNEPIIEQLEAFFRTGYDDREFRLPMHLIEQTDLRQVILWRLDGLGSINTYQDMEGGGILLAKSAGWKPLPAQTTAPPANLIDFSHALEALKDGYRVARAGWNGKGMFIYHVQANSYKATSPAAKAFFGAEAMVPYGAYLAMKTVNGTVVPWLASQTDILAEDWEILKDVS